MLSNAKFIQATREFNTFDAPVPAPCFRRSLTVYSDTAVTLRVAVCGFYDLWLNGEKITRGYLAPYISNTDELVYADEYKLTLRAGENVIGLILGNGFQNNPGGYIWDFDKASFRSAPKFALAVFDGEGQTLLVSDTTWKTAPSAILADDYRFGVQYDARQEISGWNLPGFEDKAWANVLLSDVPGGEIRIADVAPVIAEKEITPVSIARSGDGYIYDFGEINAGICRLRICGKAGQTVELRHAEEVIDGDISLNNVWISPAFWERDRKIVHLDTYTCKGAGEEIYEPAFTYHGFRYVRVDGITEEQATPALLTYVVLHTDLHTRGDFTCSDETANTIQDNTRRSILSNFYHFPTDCPQREKNGWTGDAVISAEAAILNFDPERNYREWLRNVCIEQDEQGKIPGIVPTSGWGYTMNGPAWDSVLVWLPYLAYVYRGETAMIEESAAAFIKYLRFLRAIADEKGLIWYGLGDWCYSGLEKPIAPGVVTNTILSMDIANKVAFLLDVIGQNAEAEYARREAEQYRNAFRTHLIEHDTLIVNGKCQTSQAMALYYGIFDASECDAAFTRLLEIIHAVGDSIDMGILGGRVLFHVLSEYGYADLAWKMAIENDWPSYGDCVRKGATTLWENFCPKGIGPEKLPLSLNHHFWGDISAWFIKAVAGIRMNPDGHNVNRVEIRPSFITALDNASAYYDAPAGRVASSWKRDGDAINLTLAIPDAVDAVLVLRDGMHLADGASSAKVNSGTYRVLCTN